MPRSPHKPRRAISLAKMKKDADGLFSLFIRAKYPKRCYTCGKEDGKLQCGHFVSRMYLATRWLENNARPQCVGCNIWGRGKPLDFEENLKKEIGSQEVENLKVLRHKITKMTRNDYEILIKRLEKKLNALTQVND